MSAPSKPQGTTRHVTHHRALHERVFGPEPMIKSSNTIKASRDSAGVYSLDVVNSGAKTASRTPGFPFKIYQPTNYAKFQTGIAFLGLDGTGTVCNIDATVPTDFSAIPPTVNPKTDAWRFWAVRSGEIELRPLYNLNTNYSNNWTYQYPVIENSDGISPFDFDRTPVGVPSLQSYYTDPTTETAAPPLIIGSPGGADGPGGSYEFAFWIRVTPDIASGDSPTARIEARDCSLVTTQLPSLNVSNLVPIGIVTFYGTVSGIPLLTDQMVFDHIRNRYPQSVGTFGAGSWVNNRGTWDKDGGVFDPPDLSDQVFYPGDVVFATWTNAGFKHSAQFQISSNVPIVWQDPFLAPAGRWKAMWDIFQ